MGPLQMLPQSQFFTNDTLKSVKPYLHGETSTGRLLPIAYPFVKSRWISCSAVPQERNFNQRAWR